MPVRALGLQARAGSSAELLVGPPLPFSPGPGGPALQPGGPWGAKVRASENLTYPQAPTATRVEGAKDGQDDGRWQWPWLGQGRAADFSALPLLHRGEVLAIPHPCPSAKCSWHQAGLPGGSASIFSSGQGESGASACCPASLCPAAHSLSVRGLGGPGVGVGSAGCPGQLRPGQCEGFCRNQGRGYLRTLCRAPLGPPGGAEAGRPAGPPSSALRPLSDLSQAKVGPEGTVPEGSGAGNGSGHNPAPEHPGGPGAFRAREGPSPRARWGLGSQPCRRPREKPPSLSTRQLEEARLGLGTAR